MKDPFLKGNYYHIYNRGCNKENIFFNDQNYVYLLRKIKTSINQFGVAVIAYCLMPNHYHFLLRQETELPLSRWIQWLFNGYVQAVNKQQERSGTLFESKARHIWVDRDSYLLHLARYIHINPLVANLVSKPEKWLYSNYLEWTDQRNGNLVDKEFIKSYFPESNDYKDFVIDYAVENKLVEQLQKYYLDS